MRNKKAEFILLSTLLLLVLISGIYYLEGKFENKLYIGDSLNKTYYYMDSKNPQCKIEEVKIDTDNLKFFESSQEAENQGYKKDPKC